MGLYNTKAEIVKENEENSYLQIKGTETYGAGSVFKRFTSVSGPMSVEYRFKAKERGNFEHKISDNYDNPGIELMFGEDGKIKLKNKAGNYVNIASYNKNKWYSVRFEIDTDKESYDLYLDGKKVKKQVQLDENVYKLSELEFTNGGYGCCCCLEDIKVLNKW